MKRRNLIITILLLVSSIIFIVLLKRVDIKCDAVNNSCIGFAPVNQFIFDKIGVNMTWYTITDWLGIIPILMSMVYAIVGLKQLIKRKSIKKVDNEIIILGIFYIIIISIYVLFEKYPQTAINYITFLSEKVRFLNEKLNVVSCSGTENTVLKYLTSIADKNGEIQNFKNMSLVSKSLGISRASLYRALNDLEQNGYIIKENNYIKVIHYEKTN